MSTNQNQSLAIYMKRPDVLAKFTDVLGKDAAPYVQSVLIAVSGSPDLMKCTNESIFRSALRAASLGLSCDPALKQAWLVPYNKKIKSSDGEKWVKEAQFQPHYRGLYNLAVRTGKYWTINVKPIYEGQRVLENNLTGLHAVMEENGVIGNSHNPNAAYTDVTTHRKSDKKVIGWLGYFKAKRGLEKSVYMSCGEIADHAEKYVKDYDKNPNWNDPDKRAVMEMKTVLRQLLSWADLSGSENSKLVEALQADTVETEAEVIDASAKDVSYTESKPIPAQMTYEQAQQVRSDTPWGNLPLGNLDRDKINSLYWHELTTENEREAMRIILATEYQVEPPEKPGKSQDQNLKELGFA